MNHSHWQLIPHQQFCCPAPPASTRLRQGWHRLLRLLGLGEEAPPERQDPLPDYRGFDRAPAVAAMDRFFDDWPEPGDGSVWFLLDPPYSGSAAIARDWAHQRGWARLSPPLATELEAADLPGWWRRQGVSGPWLVDDLARYLLRTTGGMGFLRALMVWLLQAKDHGPGLVVCDSWLLGFIDHGLGLAPPRLCRFAPATPGLLRQLGIRGDDRALARLAARARGNVGLALAIQAAEQDSEQSLPEPPANADDLTAFVLHALLLHRGLLPDEVRQVLPGFAGERLACCLLRLEQGGLVQQRQGRWRVRVFAYPAVREFLAARDMCLDSD